MINGSTENISVGNGNQNAKKGPEEATGKNGEVKPNGQANHGAAPLQNGGQPKNGGAGPHISTLENAAFADLLKQYEGS